MGFDTPDPLAERGYVAGDVVALLAFNHRNEFNATTSSSTYETISGLASFVMPPTDDLTPDGTVQVRLIYRIDPGGTETVFSRLQNLDDSEAMGAEVSRDATGFADSGWVEYTPTTTDEEIEVVQQIRNSTGSDTSTIGKAAAFIGVQL